MSDYEKCGLYPHCTMVECDCHFMHILKGWKQNMKSEKRKKKIDEIVSPKKKKKKK